MVSKALAAALSFGAVDAIMAEVTHYLVIVQLRSSSFMLQYKFRAHVVALGSTNT